MREQTDDRKKAQAVDVSSLSTEEIETLIHELQVHQVELQAQNEDLRAAQRELADTRDRFLELYERAPVGYLTLDKQGLVRSANLTATKILGAVRGEIVGRRFETFIAALARDDCHKLLYRSVGEEHLTGEFPLEQTDGAPRWIRLEAVWNDSRDADQGEWWLTLHDITARKQGEIALRESEARSRQLAELLPIGVYRCDAPSGTISYFNRHAATLWGRSPEIGSPDEQFCGSFKLHRPGGDPLPRDATPMAVALREGRSFHGEEMIIERPDGTRIHVLVNIEPIRDTVGTVVGAINAFVDVTESRRAQREMEDFFENASVGLHWVGPDGFIQRANRAELDMLGYHRDEYVGRHIAEFHVDQPVIEDILQRLTRGETLRDQPARMRCKDGSIRDVLINSTVMFEDGRFIHTRCFTLDVTEQERIRNALEESEARFRMLADAAPVLVWMSGPTKEGIYFNKRWLDFVGKSIGTQLGHGWLRDVHPDDQQMLHDACLGAFKSRREFTFEFRLRRADGAYRWLLDTGAPRYLPGGEFAGFIGSCVDITDRKESERRLRESEARFSNFMRHLPGLAWIKDDSGRYVYANDAAQSAFQTPLDRLRGKTDEEVFPAPVASQFKRNDERAIEEGAGVRAVETLRHADGTIHHSVVSKFPIPGAEGDAPLVGGIAIDITDRVRMEQELRASEERFRRVVRVLPAAVYTTDADGRITLYNDLACALWGRRPNLNEEKWCGWAKLFHPDGRPMPPEECPMALALLGVRAARGEEILIEQPDGTRLNILAYPERIFDAEDRLVGAINMLVDVTQRKRDEQALRESEERFRTLAHALPAMVWVARPDGSITYLNPRWGEYTGQTAEEGLGHGWVDVVPEEDREALRAHWQRCTRAGAVYEGECRYRRRDGEIRRHVYRALPVLDDEGRPTAWYGASVDIEDLRRAEDALRDSEVRYRAIVEGQSEMICRFRPDGTILFVNGAYARAHGTTPERLQGKNFWQFVDDRDKHSVRGSLDRLRHNAQEVRIENRIETEQGIRWTLWTNRAISFDADGRADEIQSVGIDITSRKRAEEALRENRRRLSTLVANLPGVAYRTRNDERRRAEFVSAGVWDLTGYDADEFRSGRISWARLMHPDDAAAVDRAVGACTRDRLPYRIEYRIRHRDGSERWVWDQGEAVYEDDEPCAWEGYVADVTERKHAEEARAFAAAIVNSSQDAIISKTLEGRITSWNAGAERIFGHTAAEAVGQSIHILIPNELYAEEAEILAKLARGERIEHFETQRMRRDGRRIEISLTVSPILDGQGRVVGASSTARDISQRKRAEQALIESERRFRLMADAAPVMIWIAGPDNKCFWFNRQWLEFTGQSIEEEVRSGWAQRVHPDDLERSAQADEEAFHRRKPLEMEYRFLRHDGAYRWLLDHGVPLYGANGELTGYIGSCIDITERKEAEAALAAKEAELALIAETTPLLLCRCSRDLRYQFVNQAAASFLRRSPRQIVGRSISEVMGERAFLKVKPYIDRVLRGDRVQFELEIPYRGAGVRWMHVNYIPERDARGEVVGWLASILDISDRRRAEEALRESEVRLRTVIDTAVDGIIIADERGRIESLNPSASRIFGYPSEEVLGNDIGMLLPEPYRTEYTREFENHREMEIKTFIGTGREVRGLRKGGSEFPMDLAVSETVLDGGRRIITGIVRDITKRKQAEEALRDSEARLRAVIETAVDGIITIDEQGRIESFNPAAMRLFGYEAEEVVGRNVNMLMPNPYQEEHDSYLDNYLKTGTRKIIGIGREVTARRKDGSVFPVDLAVSELKLDGRRLFTGIIHDLTKRKQAEEALRDLNHTLERRVAERTKLLTLLSETANAANEAETLDEALVFTLKRITEHNGWTSGHAYLVKEDGSGRLFPHGTGREAFPGSAHQFRKTASGRRSIAANRLRRRALLKGTVQWTDHEEAVDPLHEQPARRACVGSTAALPILAGETAVGILEFWSERKIRRTKSLLESMAMIGTQLGRVVERQRFERRLARALLAEQERVGRDLHDTVGQELAGIALIAERMVKNVRAGRRPQADALAELRDGARDALHSVRAVVRGLLPPVLEQTEAFEDVLAELAETISNRFKVRCEVECPHPVVVDAPDTAAYLYRIAAEAVTNAAKHARSPHIRVRMAIEEGHLVLEVRDNGVGIAPEVASEGFGLRILQHRARVIGAKLEIRREDTGGTTVRCILPEDQLRLPTYEEDSDGEDPDIDRG